MISHCNIILAFLDELEEFRDLFLPERNFRNILKRHLQNLLHYQQVYWKQRYTEKLVKWGDENTKIFHARATERFRRNVITQIITANGREVTDHEEKAALFWQEFKQRLGVSIRPKMLFNLQTLMDAHELDELVALYFR